MNKKILLFIKFLRANHITPYYFCKTAITSKPWVKCGIYEKVARNLALQMITDSDNIIMNLIYWDNTKEGSTYWDALDLNWRHFLTQARQNGEIT